jgi:ADP-ribose pyrophosphatase
LARAQARAEPLSGDQMASGVSALVRLRFRHDMAPAQSGERHVQGCPDLSRATNMEKPRIRSRRLTTVSPWVKIMEREVEFSRGAPVEIYHAVEQPDYIAVVALTPAGKIPIVRQFRPALEAYSWELPAGLVDPAEKPIDCARRELAEETGLAVRSIHSLGETFPCTGRLNNRIHSFFVRAGSRMARFEAEPGITVKLVSPAELARLIRAGNFSSHLHIGALLLAELHGFLALPRSRRRLTRPVK